MKVLVIEDNEILSRNIVRYLSLKNIHAEASLSWDEWYRKAILKYYDVVLLDINLPWLNWYEICTKIREKEKDTAIIMLTSMWWNDDIVKWLEIWADDYLVKPFDYDILIARMNAVVRRKMVNKSNTIIKSWEVILDLQKVEVKNNWSLVNLSKLEYDLLKYLLQNKWVALKRQEIYENVWWEFDWDFMFSKTIDVYIWYLRKKFWKEFIETKKGYWFLIK